MKSILVTGGAGFIGSYLVDRILGERLARVTVIDNFNDFYDPQIKRDNVSSHLERNDFDLIEADISDASSIDVLFGRNSFDVVVHLAAKAGVRPSLDDPLAYEQRMSGAHTRCLKLLEDMAWGALYSARQVRFTASILGCHFPKMIR